MLEQIGTHVYTWTEMHGMAKNQPYPWNSHAIHLPDEDTFILVDPLLMSDQVAMGIERIATPTHILLTCENHVRASAIYRDRWGCRIWGNEVERDKFEIKLDGFFQDRQRLWNQIELITIPDVKFFETAFLIKDGEDILILGDLLAGGRMDAGIPDGEFAVEAPEYVSNLAKARKSLYRLLDFQFGIMCFAHGTPVRDNPYEKLQAYLDTDQVWENLEESKRIRGTKIAQ